MSVPAVISPETKAEAAAWMARLRADDRDARDEAAFRAWLTASPANAKAFEAVTATWDLADGLKLLHAGIPAAPSFPVRRRGVLTGMGVLAAIGAGLGVWNVAYAGVYETEIGEQKHVSLSDGTQVFLDTDTRLRERFDDALRKVELERGRANFHVRPDPSRPFVVDAGAQRIIADRTVFDVRRDGDKVSVVLLQGDATVLPDRRARPRRVRLAHGQRLVAVDTDIRIDTPNLAPLVAWQTGQAFFDNETLASASAEMNRYSTMRLEVDDPVVGRLKLSGDYRVGDNEAFARAVSALLPVVIERYADHIVFVRDDSRMPEG